MPNKNQIKKINQNSLQRRFSISMAGARSGARLLSKHVTSLFLAEDDKCAAREQALAKEARIFADQLGHLKGAYVKIGQMMALYGEHLLPPQVSEALHELEHRTSSMEWSVIEPVLEQELGSRYRELIIDQNPIAAASLSQVHRARTVVNQRALCIKVQYPGVANTIDADFKAIMQMLRLTRWVQSGRDIEAWMQEVKTMLADEVDYLRERTMTERIAALLKRDLRYVVPNIEARYSGPKVLTMDYIEGYEVSHFSVVSLSQRRRNELAKSMLDVFFKEVFTWGIMQTDPNFGNYRVQLRRSPDQPDKLVMLDFGAVRELDEGFMCALRKTIVAAYHNDRAGVIAGAIELNCLRTSQPQSAKESFADFCILLMEPFRKNRTEIPAYALNSRNQYKWYESNLLKRVGKLGAKAIAVEGFRSPPKEFALIARKLTGVFTFVSTLRAEINAYKILDQYL